MKILKKNKLIKLSTGVCMAAMLCTHGIALAAEDAKKEDDKYKGLEEITVTASKRQQTVQETGMSLTAMNSDQLERMSVSTFADFAVRVPNLGFGNESDGRFNSNSPAIRGVFGDNTTGFYIDDMPVPMSMQPRVVDVERIEVLRGPQGTLYGARSMGGTIRMISKQPEFNETFGHAHAIISTVKEGDLNWSLDAAINLPVIEDKMAVRLMAYYGANSGVFDREYQSSWVNAQTGATVKTTAPAFERQENVDDERYGGFQILAKIALSDNFTFSPRFMYQKVKADGLPFADKDPANFTEKRFFNIQESGSDRWLAASGTFEWDLESATITSTTSYFDRFLNEREEESSFIHSLFNKVIGLVIDPLEGPIDENESFKSFVHETRYVSAYDGPAQITAGVFYQKSKNHLKYPAARVAGLDAAVAAVGGPPAITGGGDLIYTTDNKFDVEEIAAFAEVSYDITEELTVTAGARVYKTTTKSNITSDGFANGGKTTLKGTQSESGVNPKLLLQYSASDNVDFYTSASKGFRVGGVNGNLPVGLCGDELKENNIDPSKVKTYNSDSLWSYEAGIKTRFADNRVSINASVYMIKWDDMIQQNRLACGFQYKANAGAAEIRGMEAEVNVAPTEGLTFSVSGGFAHTKITDTGGISTLSIGHELQGVPEFTMAASAEYIWDLNADLEGMLRVDYSNYGESFSTNNKEKRIRPEWRTVNVRASIMANDWEVSLFVKNLTNTHANLADSRAIAAETLGRPRFATNRPRTMGIDFRKRF